MGQSCKFLNILLGVLSASLLKNIWACKGIKSAGAIVTKTSWGKTVIRAG